MWVKESCFALSGGPWAELLLRDRLPRSGRDRGREWEGPTDDQTNCRYFSPQLSDGGEHHFSGSKVSVEEVYRSINGGASEPKNGYLGFVMESVNMLIDFIDLVTFDF